MFDERAGIISLANLDRAGRWSDPEAGRQSERSAPSWCNARPTTHPSHSSRSNAAVPPHRLRMTPFRGNAKSVLAVHGRAANCSIPVTVATNPCLVGMERQEGQRRSLRPSVRGAPHPKPSLPRYLPDQTSFLHPGQVALNGRPAGTGQGLGHRRGDQRPLGQRAA